jgi:hypothetical protein
MNPGLFGTRTWVDFSIRLLSSIGSVAPHRQQVEIPALPVAVAPRPDGPCCMLRRWNRRGLLISAPGVCGVVHRSSRCVLAGTDRQNALFCCLLFSLSVVLPVLHDN